MAPSIQNNSGPRIRLACHSYGRLSVRWTDSGRGRFNMRRREFITLLSGAAVVWPLDTPAQQSKPRRVGVLILGNADAQSFGAELRAGMREHGYFEGQNIE